MNKRFITVVLILVCVSFIVRQSYACTDPPIPRIANEDYQDVCVGCSVHFDGIGSSAEETGSYDPDNGSPYGGGNGIDKYYWNFGDDPNWYGEEGDPNHTYDIAGIYTVALKVVDDDNMSSDYNDYCEVWVYKIDKVVKEGTTDEGPIYVCLNDTVDVNLEAIPYPSATYFPTDKIVWEVNQPEDANAVLDPNSGSLTTTLSGLTELGDYVVNARCGCGPNDPGDDITVSVSPNPSFASTLIAYTKAGYDPHGLSTGWLEPPLFEDVKYDPAFVCYCDDEDHRTSLGNGFYHVHFPVGFPFSYDIDKDGDLARISHSYSRKKLLALV